MGRKNVRVSCCFLFLIYFVILGCSTKKVMEDDEVKFKDINEEYNQVVKVEPIETTKPPKPLLPPTSIKKTAVSKKSEATKSVVKTENPKQVSKITREPEIEDTEGFLARRPLVDPFRPNESVTLEVSYFKVTAGEMNLHVGPYRTVNGRSAYHYYSTMKSNRSFSLFYAINNSAETFVDYESLLPMTYSIDAKESSRIKEVRTFFDNEKQEATHWEKVVKKNGKENKKKINWTLQPYAQNMISAVYYLRNFQLVPGKKFSFRVAGDGKNYTFKGEVLKRETLDTALGPMKTVVVRPEFTLEDELKATGDNLIWLTDDDRKFIVRIEAELKIGTLVAKVKSIQKGDALGSNSK